MFAVDLDWIVMITEVFFDIETKKLFDQIPDPSKIEDLGVSVVSVYRRKIDENNLLELEGVMKSFWADEAQTLVKQEELFLDQMWDFFENADRVVGFNSVKFDVPILAPLCQRRDFMKLPHFDILEKVKDVLGHRVSLDSLAKETLGESKLASGLDAVDWWNRKDEESLSKLKKYCEQDVMVTMKLYDFAMKNSKLRFKNKWNEIKEFGVDFSHPKKTVEPQLGLFS